MPQIPREFGTLYYRARGEGPECIVLLHDYFGTHQSWDVQALQCSRYMLVLAPDLRAHGKSVLNQGGMSIREMAEDILAMLDDADVDRAHLAGCSHGAVIALHLARMSPERVASITVTSIPDLAEPDVIEYGKQFVSSVYPRLEAELAEIHGSRAEGYVREILLASFRQSLESPPDDHLDALAKADEIGVPTLVLGGDRDPVMPPTQALRLARRINGAEFGILPQTGHLAHRESPVLYTEHVRDFILRHKLQRSNEQGGSG